MVNGAETGFTTAMLDGTFDPLHGGHIGQLLRAHVVRPFDKAYILVNKEPTHKPNASAYQHRVCMARLAMQAVQDLPFEYEVVATNNTLHFGRQTPIDYKVTGPDSVMSDLADPARHAFLTEWRLLVLSYPGLNRPDLEAAMAATPDELRSAMDYTYIDESRVPLMNYDFEQNTIMTERVHSTDIRGGGFSHLIPAAAHQYIHANHLYGR